MRCLFALALAACEFVPAPPPPSPAPSPSPAPVSADAAVAVDAAPAIDAAPALPVTDECVRTSKHIIDVMIATAPDASLKASYETSRAASVQRTAEACTKNAWTPEHQRCMRDAKLEVDLLACENKFPPPK